jgi:hypothetical protein
VLRWTGQTPSQTMMLEVCVMTWWCLVPVLVHLGAQSRVTWPKPRDPRALWVRV